MANTPADADGVVVNYECKVFHEREALFGVENPPTNAFYFVIMVLEEIALHYFPTGSNVWELYANFHEFPYDIKRVVVKFDAIAQDVAAAFNPISVALTEVDIPTVDHPRMIANIHSNAARLAQEFGYPHNGTVPILVAITKLIIRIIDLDEFEEDEEWDDKDGPLTECSIAALAKVKLDESGGECPICLEEMAADTEVTFLPCNHFFHGGCIANWLRLRNVCPLCRFRIPSLN